MSVFFNLFLSTTFDMFCCHVAVDANIEYRSYTQEVRATH
jgi:hypothetical protein